MKNHINKTAEELLNPIGLWPIKLNEEEWIKTLKNSKIVWRRIKI